jgi:hypothetical protein
MNRRSVRGITLLLARAIRDSHSNGDNAILCQFGYDLRVIPWSDAQARGEARASFTSVERVNPAWASRAGHRLVRPQYQDRCNARRGVGRSATSGTQLAAPERTATQPRDYGRSYFFAGAAAGGAGGFAGAAAGEVVDPGAVGWTGLVETAMPSSLQRLSTF